MQVENRVQLKPGPTPNHLINRIARLLARIGEPRLRELGLSVAQLPVLTSLSSGVAVTQKELARAARIEQPTMAEMLTRMKRDGIVVLEPNPDDKRSKLISLTKVATARIPAVRAILARGHQEAFKGFSEAEVATLVALLQRVIRNLEEIETATESS